MFNPRENIGEHSGWNEGFLTEWMFSLRRDLSVASMVNRSTEYMDETQMAIAMRLFQTKEAEMSEDSDSAGWEAYCGKYEQLMEDFRLDEVYMKDGGLYAAIIGTDGPVVSRLYPIGDKTFGRVGGFARITFGEACLTIDGTTCRKL